MTTDAFTLASELYKFMPHCKRCSEHPYMVPDKSAKPVVFLGRDKKVSTISKPLIKHESELCLYHLKIAVGLFNMKFPLENECETLDQMWHKVKSKPFG